MVRTTFEKKNKMFTDKAHLVAQKVIYPGIFKCSSEKLTFETINFDTSERGRILDGQMGVDRLVRVEIEKLKAPLEFMVQERFRDISYSTRRDLTITEWNNVSDLPSELYKIKAGLFVYGYFDEIEKVFGEVIVICVTDLLLALALDKIQYKKEENKKKQFFLGFDFDDLNDVGIVRWWKKI